MGPGIQKATTPNPSPTGIAQSAFVKRTFSGLNEIREELIDKIVDLAPGHPVFRVVFFQGLYEMVIKAEEQGRGQTLKETASNFNNTAATMSLIKGSAVAEALNKKELEAVNKAVKNGKGTPELKTQLGRPAVWVKMKYRNKLMDMQKPDFNGVTAKQQANIAVLMPKLQGNEKAWTSLGEVLAGDFFVGNTDRATFTPARAIPSSKTGKIAPAKTKLANPGNIFFKFDSNGDIDRTVALDNFDPNAASGDLSNADITEWKEQCAPVLKHESLRIQFATGLVAEMIAHAADMGTQIDFYMMEESYLLAGIKSGIRKLKTRLVAEFNHKENSKKIPAGVVERMKYLGWV